MSAVNENYNPGMNQSKFTHADFVQYLQNIDDIASPSKISSSPGKGSRAQGSPAVNKDSLSPNSTKSTGVHRTLKAQISDLELQNKQLSEELRRARKDLDRKGGGPGEGVSWYSASTMKSKIQQLESQWRQDTDKRVSKCLADANKQLIEKLEEQAHAMTSMHRSELEDALERQASELTANFEYQTQTAKQEYDQRFESVLKDVEHHKKEVIESQEEREKYHEEQVSSLEAQLAETAAQLSAMTEVDDIGRAAELKASEERWEKRFETYKADFEATLDSKVEEAVRMKQKEMEEIFAARETEMDSAYSKHLAETIKQCEAECAEVAGRRLEEVKEEAARSEASVRVQLAEALAEVESLKQALKQEAEANTENLNRLAGLKSSANEAQQKRLAEKYKCEVESIRLEAQAKAEEEIKQYREKVDAERSEELVRQVEDIKANWLQSLRSEFEGKRDDMLAEFNAEKAIEIENLCRSFESQLNLRSEEVMTLEDKLKQTEAERRELEENLTRDMALLRDRLETEKQVEIEKIYASSGSNEGQIIAELSEQIKTLQAKHSEQIAELRATKSVGSSHDDLGSLLASNPMVLGSTSIAFGSAVALVLVMFGTLFIQPKPMIETPVF